MKFVNQDLVRRVEMAEARIGESLVHSMLERQPDFPAAAEHLAGGIATFSGIGSPISQVVGAGLDGDVTEAELDRLEAFFRMRGAPAILELSSFAAPSFVGMLGQRRYAVLEFSNVLLRGAEELDNAVAMSKVEIQRVRPDEAKLYTETVAQGFAELLAPTQELLDVVEGFCYDPMGECFLASIAKQPAGGGATALFDGIGTLGGASVLPAFRRRGVHAALITARMRWLLGKNCEYIFTVTQPGSNSQRNMERYGFRVAYSRTKVIRKWE